MPQEMVFPLGIISRKVGPKAVLAEALQIPELARLGHSRQHAEQALQHNLLTWIAELPTDSLARLRDVPQAEMIRFTVEVPPPRDVAAWRTPVRLTLRAITWKPEPALQAARVIELAITVLASADQDLLPLLQEDSLAAIRRLKLSKDLRALAPLQMASATALSWKSLTVTVPSLKERAIRAESNEQPKETILNTAAKRLRANNLDPAYELNDTVDQLRDALTAKPPQSVLLVGPSGVGKTAAFRELIRRWPNPETRFYQTSGSRIVAGQSGFGMWEQRCQDLIQEAAKQQAILHLGNLIELLDVGKSECNTCGVASFLKPALAQGKLLGVVECTPEQLPLIEKEDPQLLEVLRPITVPEPDGATGLRILEQSAAASTRRTFSPAALQAVDRLHRRYATYSAYPGRPLNFVKALLQDGPKESTIEEGEVYARFTRETGLPQRLIDPHQPLDLGETQDWFARRVIGQPEAVQIVTQLLGTVKAGLARPHRPLASLLFIGPTGVGKTEMAKALAEFLFGSRDRLTRLDMSEYADPVSVRRLVGGAFGSEGLLTAAIREQPFSVLLLDEIEKADRSAFDLLLQALGEARLTDAGGRLADFRNTVVILTSNLGADTFLRGRSGFLAESGTTASAAEHFQKAVEAALRPEMFNRLDRIVPFAPLSAEIIRRIADREWGKVLHREGLRFRGVALQASTDLLDHIAAKGFDPRYGARPLKRAMEREVLAPLAEKLNQYSSDMDLTVRVELSNGQTVVTAQTMPSGKPSRRSKPASPVGQLAQEVQNLRRLYQLLERASVCRDLRNSLYQLEQTVRRARVRQRLNKPLSSSDLLAIAELGRVQAQLNTITLQAARVTELEDSLLLSYHAQAESSMESHQAEFQKLSRDWDELLMQLFERIVNRADRLTLAFFSEHRSHLHELEQAYRQAALEYGYRVEAVRYFLCSPVDVNTDQLLAAAERLLNDQRPGWIDDLLFHESQTPPKAYLRREYVSNWNDSAALRSNWIGSALSIVGNGAFLSFGQEAGLHVIKRPVEDSEDNPNALVVVTDKTLDDYEPSPELTRRGAIEAPTPRRIYDSERQMASDTFTGLVVSWDHRIFSAVSQFLKLSRRVQLMKIVLD